MDDTDENDAGGSYPRECQCSRCLLKSSRDPFLDGPFMDQFQQDELPMASQGGEGSVLKATAPAFAPVVGLNSTRQSDSGAAYSSAAVSSFGGKGSPEPRGTGKKNNQVPRQQRRPAGPFAYAAATPALDVPAPDLHNQFMCATLPASIDVKETTTATASASHQHHVEGHQYQPQATQGYQHQQGYQPQHQLYPPQQGYHYYQPQQPPAQHTYFQAPHQLLQEPQRQHQPYQGQAIGLSAFGPTAWNTEERNDNVDVGEAAKQQREMGILMDYLSEPTATATATTSAANAKPAMQMPTPMPMMQYRHDQDTTAVVSAPAATPFAAHGHSYGYGPPTSALSTEERAAAAFQALEKTRLAMLTASSTAARGTAATTTMGGQAGNGNEIVSASMMANTTATGFAPNIAITGNIGNGGSNSNIGGDANGGNTKAAEGGEGPEHAYEDEEDKMLKNLRALFWKGHGGGGGI